MVAGHRGKQEEDGGRREAGEQGRERLQRSAEHHLHSQPPLLQPRRQSRPFTIQLNKPSPFCPKFQNMILSQDTSDIKIDCYTDNSLRNEKICNVSAPFMRAKSQVGGLFFKAKKGDFNVCRFSDSRGFFWFFFSPGAVRRRRRTRVIGADQLGNRCKNLISPAIKLQSNQEENHDNKPDD